MTCMKRHEKNWTNNSFPSFQSEWKKDRDWMKTMSNQFCWKRLWLSPMWSWNVLPSFVIWVTHLVQEMWGEATRARVRCAWAEFKEFSPILAAWGASYHIKGKIYRAHVQSVLTYGTETWMMKAENRQSLARTERMMVRWMCDVVEG